MALNVMKFDAHTKNDKQTLEKLEKIREEYYNKVLQKFVKALEEESKHDNSLGDLQKLGPHKRVSYAEELLTGKVGFPISGHGSGNTTGRETLREKTEYIIKILNALELSLKDPPKCLFISAPHEHLDKPTDDHHVITHLNEFEKFCKEYPILCEIIKHDNMEAEHITYAFVNNQTELRNETLYTEFFTSLVESDEIKRGIIIINGHGTDKAVAELLRGSNIITEDNKLSCTIEIAKIISNCKVNSKVPNGIHIELIYGSCNSHVSDHASEEDEHFTVTCLTDTKNPYVEHWPLLDEDGKTVNDLLLEYARLLTSQVQPSAGIQRMLQTDEVQEEADGSQQLIEGTPLSNKGIPPFDANKEVSLGVPPTDKPQQGAQGIQEQLGYEDQMDTL